MAIKKGWREAQGACQNSWTLSYYIHAMGASKKLSGQPSKQGGGRELEKGQRSFF
jgi:hypothetical protein